MARGQVPRGERIGQGDRRLDDRLEMADRPVSIASLEGADPGEELGTRGLWILGAGLLEERQGGCRVAVEVGDQSSVVVLLGTRGEDARPGQDGCGIDGRA